MAKLPRRLNFGSGKSFAEDMFNIDILAARNPDLVLDLGIPFPLGMAVETRRFGPVLIERGSFDYIMADNVMEHIPNLVQAMTNCLSLLAAGGELEVRVPYDLSYGAWQDPTHVRGFNERSWLYYCEWAWYVGWLDDRFEQIGLAYVLSEHGRQIADECGHDLVRIARYPRAVDELRVTLRKRPIEPDERHVFARLMAGGGLLPQEPK